MYKFFPFILLALYASTIHALPIVVVPRDASGSLEARKGKEGFPDSSVKPLFFPEDVPVGAFVDPEKALQVCDFAPASQDCEENVNGFKKPPKPRDVALDMMERRHPDLEPPAVGSLEARKGEERFPDSAANPLFFPEDAEAPPAPFINPSDVIEFCELGKGFDNCDTAVKLNTGKLRRDVAPDTMEKRHPDLEPGAPPAVGSLEARKGEERFPDSAANPLFFPEDAEAPPVPFINPSDAIDFCELGKGFDNCDTAVKLNTGKL